MATLRIGAEPVLNRARYLVGDGWTATYYATEVAH